MATTPLGGYCALKRKLTIELTNSLTDDTAKLLDSENWDEILIKQFGLFHSLHIGVDQN